PLPFEVISGMLGVPMSDNDRVREWSSDLTAVIDPKASEELVAKAEHSEREFGAFMSDFIAWKRRNPGEDLLSLLLEAEKAGEGLTAEELIDQMILLYIAGHENTTNFIANSLVQLLANPDQLEAWRRDPGLDR